MGSRGSRVLCVIRGFSAIAVVVIAVAIAACGSSTSTNGTSGGESATHIAPASKYGGPEGTLESGGIGEVKQGMSVDQVIVLFGDPEIRETIPGCELDRSAYDLISLIYDSQHGNTGILFDADSGELQSYYTWESSLETAGGIRVGDTYDDLSKAAGDDLQPLVLGTEKPSSKNGVWYTEDGPEQRLTYDIQKGRVTQILGGYTPACE